MASEGKQNENAVERMAEMGRVFRHNAEQLGGVLPFVTVSCGVKATRYAKTRQALTASRSAA
ncbi:MAG: hypothetical protein ACT4OK_16375 [Gemmobacter sp.]